jgi:hypothetical protein
MARPAKKARPAPPTSTRRYQRNDTLVSRQMLGQAVAAITAKLNLDRTYDIPYLAGYSRNGKTIYIDKDLPQSFSCRGKRVKVDAFLILHEAVEKSLLVTLGLTYQHAHQIALRAEQEAVQDAGIPWREYDRFMQRFIKEAVGDELERIPPDLDIKPYRDEHDVKVLRAMRELTRKNERRGKK